jgi:hypothetical protein
MNIEPEKIVIFDSETIGDRYTVFPYLLDRKQSNEVRSQYIGMDDGGRDISMWGDLGKRIGLKYYRPLVSELKHLGKRIKFKELSERSQAHIISRLA